MKKRLLIIGLILVLLLGYFYIINNNRTFKIIPNLDNDTVVYDSTDLVINPVEMEAYIGFADYVFIGEVTEYVDNYIPNDDIPLSIYRVSVKENLKGTLLNSVEVVREGGYNQKGELEIYISDRNMPFPEIGKKYIFIGVGKEDGSLHLAPVKGNVEYTEDLRKNYINYIANEIVYERPRSISKYDKSLK